LRASREASTETTAPTRPSQIAARSFSKPGRDAPEPDRPRFIVDHLDGGPAEGMGAIDQPVLAAPAFVVMSTWSLVDCRR
jgi:hypothetical protein